MTHPQPIERWANLLDPADNCLLNMTVEEAVATQPGVVLVDGELHVRGGRASEVKYYVDGIAITDAATGTGGLEVSLSSLSGFDLLSGGFDAEYGNVQSGVVNLQTIEGTSRRPFRSLRTRRWDG